MDASLHDRLSSIDVLRDLLAEHGPPTPRLLEFFGYNVRDQDETLELGFSSLSLVLAQRARRHTCIVPTDEAAAAVRAIAASFDLNPERLRMLVGDMPEAGAVLPAEGFDHVVLSAPFAFPIFFAAAHAGMRLLRVGGRLTVRGAGVWTVDQLRNFLRVDPAWSSFIMASEDATAVVKQVAGSSFAWRQQPFVLVNSASAPHGVLARSAVHEAQVRGFSTTLDALQRRKAATAATAKAGLVGYYGFGNFGDELFRLAFEAGLPDVTLPLMHDVPRRPYFVEPKARKVERVDAVVIGGGDLIIPGYWTDLYFEAEFLQKPVFVHGVGVPGWIGAEPGTIHRLRQFFQHPNVKYINVRDSESKAWVEQHLEPAIPVELSPDIACGMDLGFAPPERVAGRKVFGLITRKQPEAQSQDDPIRALIARAKAAGYVVRQIIAGNGAVGEEDSLAARRRALPVDEVVFAETLEGTTAAIASCDVLASMKFHGCVVGLMSGVPTVGLITTDKFNNFYRRLGLEHLVHHYSRDDLPECLDLLAAPLPLQRIEALREEARAGMARLRSSLLAHTAGGGGHPCMSSASRGKAVSLSGDATRIGASQEAQAGHFMPVRLMTTTSHAGNARDGGGDCATAGAGAGAGVDRRGGGAACGASIVTLPRWYAYYRQSAYNLRKRKNMRIRSFMSPTQFSLEKTNIEIAFENLKANLAQKNNAVEVHFLSAACMMSLVPEIHQKYYWNLFREFSAAYLKNEQKLPTCLVGQTSDIVQFLHETTFEMVAHVRRRDPHLWLVRFHVVRKDGSWLVCDGRYDTAVFVIGDATGTTTAAAGRSSNFDEMKERVELAGEVINAGFHATAGGRQPPLQIVFNNSRPVDLLMALGRFDRIAGEVQLSPTAKVYLNRSTAFFDPSALQAVAKLGPVTFETGASLTGMAQRFDSAISRVEAFYLPDQSWAEQSDVLQRIARYLQHSPAEIKTIEKNDEFRVFVSLEFEKRVWIEQEDALLALIKELRKIKMNIKIVVNGMTGVIFKDETRSVLEFYAPVTDREQETINRWKEHLGQNVIFEHLAGLDIDRKLARIASCDFFVAPGGTAALLALLAGIPGVYYSHPKLHQHFSKLLGGFSMGLPICGDSTKADCVTKGLIDWIWAGVGGESYSIPVPNFLRETLAALNIPGPR